MKIKKLQLTLLSSVLFYNPSFAGYIVPEELNEFSKKTYNLLPLSAEADSNLKQNGKLNEFLEEVAPIVEEYGVTESMGFRLAHRHDVLQEGEKMVENFGYWENVPAFITKIEKEEHSKIYPSSWLYTSSGLKVFEYSSDRHVKRIIKSLYSPQKFFEKIGEVAEKYELQGLLAPAILGRESFNHFNEEQPLYEIINPTPYASILVNKSVEEIRKQAEDIKEANLVRTTWSSGKKQPVLCVTYCYASKADYKFHEFYHPEKR